jgi:hypothetical protein
MTETHGGEPLNILRAECKPVTKLAPRFRARPQFLHGKSLTVKCRRIKQSLWETLNSRPQRISAKLRLVWRLKPLMS